MVRNVDVPDDGCRVGGRCVSVGTGGEWWWGGWALRVRTCDTLATGLSARSARTRVARVEDGDDFRAGSVPHPLTWLRRPDAAVGDGAVVAIRARGPVGRIGTNGRGFGLEARCA
jgi:hypothetical protein